MRKILPAIFLIVALLPLSIARAGEVDLYGGYSFPSGQVINNGKAEAASLGETSSTGGGGGGISVLFGDGLLESGFEIDVMKLMSFSTSTASDSVTMVPILGVFRLRPGIFLVDLGLGFTSASVTVGNVTVSSSSSDFTLMGGAGVSFGDGFGLDLEAKVYYLFESDGNTLDIAPFAGVHFRF
jgi:hypothetical protein